MKNRISISLIFLCLVLSSSAQNYPVIHESRPRIWADEARLSWIAQHRNSGECGLTYNDFLYRYNTNWINDPQLYMVGSDSTLWTWTWSSQWAQWQSVFTVFLWKVNHDPTSLKRCRFLVRKCYQFIDTANFQPMEWYAKETLIRTFSDAGSLLLDWCHDSIPAVDRQHLALSMYRMQKVFMEEYILSSAGTSYVSSHNALNCVQAMQNVLALHNADGLSQGKKDTITNWYHVLYDKWINGFLPCYTYYRDDDGGWNWGAAYAMWSLTDQFKLFDNMYYGTTKNFYSDLPWVEESINQYWYFIQPDDYTIHLGDGFTKLFADNVIYRHAKIFQDPRSQWMAQYYSQNQYLTWTVPIFIKLFYKDFEAPAVTKPNPPLNWWSDKVGLSVSRTSWNADASLVWFFNSPSKKASHEHRDNNSFAVFHHKPLLIDAGYYDLYGTTHFANYYTRTIAHNNICVFNPDEVMYYGNQVVSNDGGQVFSWPLSNYSDIFAPQFQRGKWIQYASRDNFSYNNADAALSYDTAKLSRFTRRLLFYKPDKVVVLDHLTLKNSAVHQYDASWIMHTVTKPSMSGTLTNQSVPEHIMTYSGKDYAVTNGNGTAVVRTLLPQNTSATLIGGTGYQYWVNGSNYPVETPADTVNATPGSWRIEVHAQQVADTMVFLHTVKIGEAMSPIQAYGTALTSAYSTAVDWNTHLFIFSSKGDTGISQHFIDSLSGNRALHLWACDLKKKDSCFLFIDGTFVSAHFTGNEGIIETNIVLTPGYHTLSFEKYTLSGQVIYDNILHSPVPDATVSLYQNQVLISQTIGDSIGYFRFPGLPSGQYQLMVESSLPWGGVNSTDALLIMKHFVHMSMLTGIRAASANVDGNSTVNSLDALLTARRFTQIITGFPVGDWCFEKPMLTLLSGQNNNVSIKGLCFGDVNGSNIP